MNLIRRTVSLIVLLTLICSCAMAAETHFIPLADGESETLSIDIRGGKAPMESGYLSEMSYADSSISVNIEEMEYLDTKIFVAWVTIADPSQLRTAPAYDFLRDQLDTVENMANRVQAVIAINGDFCSFLRGGGYLIRQGVRYADRPNIDRDCLLIDDKGDFYTCSNSDRENVHRLAEGKNVINSFNFGPAMIRDGQVLTAHYGASYNSAKSKHQRTAICQMEKGSNQYVLAVSEGRWRKMGTGLTIPEWTAFIAGLGVQEAYNLDGGNSSAIIFRGHKLNEPGNQNHRQLSDIVYFASAAIEP